MRRERFIIDVVALLSLTCALACGDDGSGAGGTGGQGGATTSTGGAGTGGQGTGGSISPAAPGTMVWHFDGEVRVTSDAQPPTVGLLQEGATAHLSMNGVDSNRKASVILEILAPGTTIPKGDYVCTRNGEMPHLGIGLQEVVEDMATAFNSTNGDGECQLTLENDLVMGSAIVGTAFGVVSDGTTSFPFDVAFNVVDVAD